MGKLIVLQMLVMMEACRAREVLPTTVIQDTRTEMSVEEIRGHREVDFFGKSNEADSDLDFDYEDADLAQASYPPVSKEHLMKEAMLRAMKKPAIREQIGEVIPILRAMSPTQRLTLAALVSSQIMSQGRLSEANLTEMASMFAGNNVENVNDRQNITEHLLLPISVDIAKIFRGLGKDVGRSLREDVHDDAKRRQYRKQNRRKNYQYRAIPNRRMDVFPEDGEEKQRNATKELQNLINEGVLQPSVNDCEYFSSSFCLEVTDYPLDAIIKSVEKHQGIMDTLLEDFRIQSPEVNGEGVPPEQKRLRRRQDTGPNEIGNSVKEKEFMCPSSVKYARPKRARTTSGQWKYVVNAGDYTQTLRLEMCLKPNAPCTYVTNNYNSQCTQVYNYHRLLTWEENTGLHMDIFKVPSCCSCHIQGYNNFYPPAKDYTFAEKRREPISLRPSYNPETVEIPLFANPSGKREVVRPPPSTTPSTFQQRDPIKIVESLTPLHHLVPPGPPLPLEGESIKFRSDVNFHKKRGSGEHRRIAEVAPYKLEIGESSKNQARTKYPNVIVGRPVQKKPEASVLPLVKYYPKEDVQLFATTKTAPDAVLRKKPQVVEIFEPEPVRRVTATTAATITTAKATTLPLVPKSLEQVSSNGRKKINYNYHPIIEFFIPDPSNTTGQQYSKPLSAALTSQEWTPLVGRSRA
ncbi:UNVERIFIED_CONTAM: hypothetical protein PYX00_008975 [Menopon gallinae]|uniref:Spaetzle domain-containing protein n=1 Tax=Menopon gallinae TaxID=328185 RepID=A0AAW2H9Q4_9NEOP